MAKIRTSHRRHHAPSARGPGTARLAGGKPIPRHPVVGISPTPGRPNLHYRTPFGYIRIENLGTGQFIESLLGDGPWNLTSGWGGWNVIAKPRDLGTTEFDGSTPFTLQGPIMLDGFSEGDSVEHQIRVIQALGEVAKHEEEPPLVKLSGSIPGTQYTWVLNDIAWGDHIRRPSDNARIRAAAQLTFLQYVPDVGLRKIPASKKQRDKNSDKKRGSKKKTYRIKKGDTLQSIAHDQLHDSKRWHEIARLNHIRDPKHPGKVGSTIKLP